jgi:hypothetical protein
MQGHVRVCTLSRLTTANYWYSSSPFAICLSCSTPSTVQEVTLLQDMPSDDIVNCKSLLVDLCSFDASLAELRIQGAD